MKLSEIINTDCYIQFDSNEQLREWVKKAGIEIDSYIRDSDRFMRCYCVDGFYPDTTPSHSQQYPVYHHTNISI